MNISQRNSSGHLCTLRVLCGYILCICISYSCTATRGEPSGGAALPQVQVRPLFDELAATDNQRWQCRSASNEFEFMNENCYVDLCRGNFDSSGDLKGRGTYKGVLPQRLPDPANPTVALPTVEPLTIEITFAECEGKACAEPLKIAVKNDGSASDPSGATYVCTVSTP